jgi:hypothetical protein
MLVIGNDLATGTVQARYLVLPAPRNLGELEALVKNSKARVPVPPLTPPDKAPSLSVRSTSDRVMVCGSPHGGPFLLWAGSAALGWSSPQVVNQPRLWWLSQETAAPGTIVWGAGREVQGRFAEMARVILRSKSNGALHITEPLLIYPKSTTNNHTVYFWIPSELPDGDYEAIAYNGFGGAYGFSNPLPIKIAKRAPQARPLYRATEFGAKGDDADDDREAIQAALDKATPNAGIVYLPPGTYYTSGSIRVPDGVTLRGAGSDQTVLRILPGEFGRTTPAKDARLVNLWYPGPGGAKPVLWGRHRFAIEHLAVRVGTYHLDEVPPTGPAILVFDPEGPSENVTVRGCLIEHRIEVTRVPGSRFNLPCRSAEGLVATHGTRNLAVSDCVFRGMRCLMAEHMHRGLIYNNRFEGVPGFVGHPISIQGPTDCAIIDNILYNCPTGIHLSCTQNDRSMTHNFVAWNSLEVTRTGMGNDDGETLLVHPMDNYDIDGPVTSAGPDSILCRGANWSDKPWQDHFCLIVDGKGLGQYRRVISQTVNSFKVERPWDVVPDATSRFLVKVMSVENTFFRNAFRNAEGATGMYMDLANVVQGCFFESTLGLSLHGGARVATHNRKRQWWVSYYNQLLGNKVYVRGCIALICMSDMVDGQPMAAFPMFANSVAGNEIANPDHATGWLLTGYWGYPSWSPDQAGVAFLPYGFQRPPRDAIGARWALIEDNLLTKAVTGIGINPWTRETVLSNNTFSGVTTPVKDEGKGTIVLK